jgi:hypothetical protein
VGTPAYKLQSKTRRRACICALPCALWLWTLPPGRGGLRHCHVPHASGPCLSAREGSSAATCHMTLDLASLSRQALVLPCAPWLRTPPPYSGGLRCCHVSHSFGPRLPAQEGSGATTCPTAPNPASLLGRAPILSRVPQPSEGREP